MDLFLGCEHALCTSSMIVLFLLQKSMRLKCICKLSVTGGSVQINSRAFNLKLWPFKFAFCV